MDPDITSTEDGELGKDRNIPADNGNNTGEHKLYGRVIKCHNIVFVYPSIDFILL